MSDSRLQITAERFLLDLSIPIDPDHECVIACSQRASRTTAMLHAGERVYIRDGYTIQIADLAAARRYFGIAGRRREEHVFVVLVDGDEVFFGRRAPVVLQVAREVWRRTG